MRCNTLAGVLFGLVVALGPRGARADDAPTSDQSSPKRAVPNYDGRGPPPQGDNVGVWIARILLSPLYLVTEYLIRAPMNGLMDFLEAHDRLNKIYDFFAFGPDHKIGFVPVGFVEFSFNPSVGVYGFWNDALVDRNEVRMHIEMWPTDWIAATFSDRYTWGDDQVFEVRASGVNRPDQVFYGIGPDSLQTAQSRYREARMDVRATLDAHVWRSSRLRAWAGLRKVDLSDGYFGNDPSLSQQAATGMFAVPYGFDQGYVGPYGGLHATFDTRAADDPRSGVRLEALGDLGSDLAHGSSGWVHWGGVAGAFWDITGHRRILSLSGGVSFADPLGGGDIPFPELVSLGGDRWMPGFFSGRLLGRSSAVAMLRYDWPIASWIDGTLQAVAGNVFDAHLDGFRLGELRFSGSIGITTTTEILAAFAGAGSSKKANERLSSSGPRLEIIAGIGTDTFDRGATIQSFHLMFGVPHSF